jgi:hypothetical protein
MAEAELPNLIRTIFAAGFELIRAETKPNYVALWLEREDEFGNAVKYLLAYAGNNCISVADCAALQKLALHHASLLVVVGSNTDLGANVRVLSPSKFFGRMGGVVSSVLPLEPDFGTQLVMLGKNELPSVLRGQADDWFEAYVHAALQFLLRGRVIRYGQNRKFEAVPDGVMLHSGIPAILYDAKAARDTYEFNQTAIRQFGDYVERFHERYEKYVGRLYAFVAVSHAFQGDDVLQNRSNELYAKCGVPLVCLTADCLASTVSLFADCPIFRGLIDWKAIFTPPLVRFEKVREAVEARRRDGIVQE